MGEYVIYQGKTVKLGTCEDLYYCRFAQLKEAIEAGEVLHEDGNGQPAEYIDPINGYRYRFPFPDEDGEQIGGYYNFGFDRGIPVKLDENLAPYLIQVSMTEWDHYQGGKCPALLPETEKIVLLKQQKQVDGLMWVVIGCSFCHSKIRLDWHLAEELCKCIEQDKPDLWGVIVDRIREGYQVTK